MNDVRHFVFLDRLQDARHVEHVALLEIDLVDDVVDQAVVAVAREDDGALAFPDEFAGGLGANDAHAAGDQNLHMYPQSIFAPTALIKVVQCLRSL